MIIEIGRGRSFTYPSNLEYGSILWQYLTFCVCEVDDDLPVTECVHRSPRPPVEHVGGTHVAGLQAVPSSETGGDVNSALIDL